LATEIPFHHGDKELDALTLRGHTAQNANQATLEQFKGAKTKTKAVLNVEQEWTDFLSSLEADMATPSTT